MRIIITGLLIFAIFFFSSCTKDDPKTDDQNLIEAIKNSAVKQSINYFELPYNSRVVIDNNYFDQNISDVKLAPDLGYEVSMYEKESYSDKTAFLYFDIDGRHLNSDKGDKTCFEFIYPISYIMPDNTIISGNNKNEIVTAMKAWYESHPDSQQKPVLQFPVNIAFGDKQITLNSNEEFRKILEYCKGKDARKCFELEYPVIYIMPDGSEIPVRINNESGWANVKAWYRDHPDFQRKPQIKYPVVIIYRDGRSITISNENQMKRAYEACN